MVRYKFLIVGEKGLNIESERLGNDSEVQKTWATPRLPGSV